MVTKIVAVFLILIFLIIIIVGVWTSIRLQKWGLLRSFLRGKWFLGLLTTAFILQFIVNGIALLLEKEWAVTATSYTIYLWLVYIWAYNLKAIFDLFVLLKTEKAQSVSQLMGRSQLFDELLEKSIELSKQSNAPETNEAGEAHAVRDSEWEGLVDNEEWFQEVFPDAVRTKIRRKITGLMVLTVVFLLILALIR